MSPKLKVLIIQTYGIDIAYGIEDSLELAGCDVEVITNHSAAIDKIETDQFNAILINMEPDGKNGISGIEYLHTILDTSHQENSVCFGVSAQPSMSVLSSHPEYIKDLSILVGWLIVPMMPEKATKLIIDTAQNYKNLSVRERMHKSRKLHNVA